MATAVHEPPKLPTDPTIGARPDNHGQATPETASAAPTPGNPTTPNSATAPDAASGDGRSTDAAPGSIEALLDGLDVAVAGLIDGVAADQLTTVGDDRLVGFIRRLEEIRNRLGLVDHEIVHACQTTDLPHRLQLRTVANLLGQVTRIAPGRAHARVRAADVLRAGRSMTGEALTPTWPG